MFRKTIKTLYIIASNNKIHSACIGLLSADAELNGMFNREKFLVFSKEIFNSSLKISVLTFYQVYLIDADTKTLFVI